MKFVRFNLNDLHNEEWFSLFCILRPLINKYGAEVLGIADLFNLLLPQLLKADVMLVILRKSIFTAKMKKAAKERNSLFKGLLDVVKSGQELDDDARREAAVALYVLLSQYKKTIQEKSYSESESSIYNLLQDLKTPKYAPGVALLGFDKWVGFIGDAENRFLEYRASRTQESIEKPKEQLRSIRRLVDLYYNAILDRLYTKVLADGLGEDVVVDPESLKDGIYEADTPDHLRGNIVYNFMIEWNETLKKYHTLIAQREGRRAKKNDSEEEAETEVPEVDEEF